MANLDNRGWWINAKGESVHKDLIKVNEQLKDELVEKLIAKAKQTSGILAVFKEKATENIDAYFGLLLQEYGMNARSKKGNITLENFSGTMKVQMQVSETLHFDEKIQIAKAKIDEYLTDVTKDSIPEIVVLITRAFDVDKEGNIDAKKIFALRSYDIRDVRWREAMEIIDESKKIAYTKRYIRFYERDRIDVRWRGVNLDIANS